MLINIPRWWEDERERASERIDRSYRYDNWWPRSCLDKIQISPGSRQLFKTAPLHYGASDDETKLPKQVAVASNHSPMTKKLPPKNVTSKKKRRILFSTSSHFKNTIYIYIYNRRKKIFEYVINKDFFMRIINRTFIFSSKKLLFAQYLTETHKYSRNYNKIEIAFLTNWSPLKKIYYFSSRHRKKQNSINSP